MIPLETPRLILRRWREEDRAPFRQMNTDPMVMEFFPKSLNAEESDDLVHRIQEEFSKMGWGLWAVEERSSGEFLGFIGFHRADFPADFTPCIEIGWRLRRSAWGLGYATEGARRCLKEGFEAFDFDQVLSFTSELNIRSRSVMERIGLKKLGDFLHPGIPRDNPLCPHVLYSLRKEEFLAYPLP